LESIPIIYLIPLLMLVVSIAGNGIKTALQLHWNCIGFPWLAGDWPAMAPPSDQLNFVTFRLNAVGLFPLFKI
jgi:hypothetical protein